MAEAIERAVFERIPEDDPVWLAVLRAPIDLTPDTEEELAAIEELRRNGKHSVPGEHVSAAIAARSRREELPKNNHWSSGPVSMSEPLRQCHATAVAVDKDPVAHRDPLVPSGMWSRILSCR